MEPFTLMTDRLFIRPITSMDAGFILELVNSEGWLRFIGNRQIHSEPDSEIYIGQILENKDQTYWVVCLKDQKEPVGVVTCIQRAYLEYPDIGFAFLPGFIKKGFAYEATLAVLKELIRGQDLSYIHAITSPDNKDSIRLLDKLGLVFENELFVEKGKIYVYGCSSKDVGRLVNDPSAF